MICNICYPRDSEQVHSEAALQVVLHLPLQALLLWLLQSRWQSSQQDQPLPLRCFVDVAERSPSHVHSEWQLLRRLQCQQEMHRHALLKISVAQQPVARHMQSAVALGACQFQQQPQRQLHGALLACSCSSQLRQLLLHRLQRLQRPSLLQSIPAQMT